MRLDFDATKREFVGAVLLGGGESREVRIPVTEVLTAIRHDFAEFAFRAASPHADGLERLHSLDLQARALEGVETLTADILVRWLNERRDFAVALAKRA